MAAGGAASHQRDGRRPRRLVVVAIVVVVPGSTDPGVGVLSVGEPGVPDGVTHVDLLEPAAARVAPLRYPRVRRPRLVGAYEAGAREVAVDPDRRPPVALHPADEVEVVDVDEPRHLVGAGPAG